MTPDMSISDVYDKLQSSNSHTHASGGYYVDMYGNYLSNPYVDESGQAYEGYFVAEDGSVVEGYFVSYEDPYVSAGYLREKTPSPVAYKPWHDGNYMDQYGNQHIQIDNEFSTDSEYKVQPPWVLSFTEDGNMYYYNSETHATTWNIEDTAWILCTADDGNQYNYNTLTHQSSWVDTTNDATANKETAQSPIRTETSTAAEKSPEKKKNTLFSLAGSSHSMVDEYLGNEASMSSSTEKIGSYRIQMNYNASPPPKNSNGKEKKTKKKDKNDS
jgi:hypothetical protein